MRRKRQKFTIPSKYLLLIMTCVCVLFMAVTISLITTVEKIRAYTLNKNLAEEKDYSS